MKFRKKPVVIDAWQYTGNNGREMELLSPNVKQSPVLEPSEDNPTGSYLQIATLEGVMTVNVNDWIIRGTNGELYCCEPNIFEKFYEKVSDE